MVYVQAPVLVKNYILMAKEKECDVYISGDLSYHDAQTAFDADICFIDATHYGTEVLVLDSLCEYLSNKFKILGIDIEVFVSKSSINIIETY